MHYRRFYLRFRKRVENQWFVENHPVHFAAYRLPTKSVPGLLCLTLFEREEYFAWFSKTIEKKSHWNPLNKGDYKTFILFLFSFSKSNHGEPCLKTTRKNIKTLSGVGYSNTFIPDISIRKASE
jgi:hypothetical protein